MAATHQTGHITGSRLGCASVIHTIKHTFADATGVNKKVLTVPGSTLRPGAFRCIGAVIVTSNDAATSATLSIGTINGAFNDMVNAQNSKNFPGTNLTLASNPVIVVSADTDIYITPAYVGTPTVGEVDIFIEVWDVNLAATTNQGD